MSPGTTIRISGIGGADPFVLTSPVVVPVVTVGPGSPFNSDSGATTAAVGGVPRDGFRGLPDATGNADAVGAGGALGSIPVLPLALNSDDDREPNAHIVCQLA